MIWHDHKRGQAKVVIGAGNHLNLWWKSYFKQRFNCNRRCGFQIVDTATEKTRLPTLSLVLG